MSSTMEAVLERDAASDPSEAGAGPGSRAEIQTTRQFVTFHMENETFAVPLTDVQEIIRLPAMVEVPMAAASLEGLANLRGSVLPILNLRRIFQMPDVVHDDSTRVVVLNNGKPVGFVVDRMARVVTAEPREIESIDGIRATVDTDLLEGIIKRAQAMIMILSTSKLAVEMGQLGTRGPGKAGHDSGTGVVDAKAEAADSDEIQLVSFELDRQEYALPIESVQEIVQVPETINSIPNAQGHVLGVMNLRNRLLPLVSLRSMFGLPSTAVGEQSRIVVVAHSVDGQVQAVGLVTDTVKEVLRIPRSIVDPLPNLLSSGSGQREIENICRMDGGKRLVSILLPDRLFLNSAIRDAIGGMAETDGQSDMKAEAEIVADRIDDEEQFVVFRVAEEEYGVPIDAVQEIVRIPDQLTRVPKSPAFVEGVVNLRGAVLPVIDQRRRFSLPDVERNDRQRIMVFMVHGVRTGFIVDSVSEVLKIARSQISEAPDVAVNDGSAVARVANIVNLKRMILMLDVERLLTKSETNALKKARPT
ncbi:chemotaxis protein CheW [Lichenifustis flavocetrariae]|uniref:Chemotaxis protein CheW n=1 Tax=Lichenifustis flavocetrariae TaxID=2949735 RepID=A0AA42CMG1_9HYPH|nr:chemotaxis protein CheW [Lichenifustis flavocetrariae]MCW6511551.1 chemotaxis protein CheW [Lichenifustis flavocetrariae]